MKWIKRDVLGGTLNKKDSLADRIAKIRGIEDVDRFLNPTREELCDPYLMKNIEAAANRIAEAISQGQRIIASSDPDADGLASLAIMIRYLKRHGADVDYIYGQRGDGHGIENMIYLQPLKENEKPSKPERHELNSDNIKKIMQADLLLLLDSSSSDTEACKRIAEWGTDIIILDHHRIEQDNPHVILVNPQQKGCKYPNKHLSGAGVVFKTLQVLEDTLDADVEVNPFDYIDLVAVGMYADVMRIDVHENRYLIMEGMRNMKNMGLVTILKSAKADLFRINSSTIGFTLGPLLNGVTRMDRIELAIEILLQDEAKACQKLRREMSKVNDLRKARQTALAESYEHQVDPSKKVLMVLDDQSSKGFNGMIAQQLADRFKRPVIVGRVHKGKVSGSFRSYGDFHFQNFLKGFGNIKSMGHPTAGGIEVKEELLNGLMEYIEEHMPDSDSLEPSVEYDLEMNPKEAKQAIKTIEQFNLLTGNGFPAITVRITDLSVDDVLVLGETRNTVKIKTFEGVELIKFRVNEFYGADLEVFDSVSAIGQLQNNIFYNFQTKKTTITPQLIVEDYKSY